MNDQAVDALDDFTESIEDYAEETGKDDERQSENFRYNIDTFTNAIPVERLVDDFTHGIIKVPEIQRPHVWYKKDRKTARHRPSVFIDSILQGLPIPPITIYRNAKAREEGLLIDGRQRLTTLAWFITGTLSGEQKKFALNGEAIRDEWQGKTFKDLAESYQDILKRAYIPVTFVRQLTDDTPQLPNASSLYVLFDRLNSGGYTLHPHEKRAVLVTHNKSYEVMSSFLKAVYALEDWSSIIESLHTTEDDYRITLFHENIFRVFAYMLYIDNYKGILARFLDDFMINYSMNEDISKRLLDATKKALLQAKQISASEGIVLFKPLKKFNIAFYEMFIYSLVRIYFENKSIEFSSLLTIYNNIVENKIFYDANDKTKSDATSVKARFSKAYDMFLSEAN